MQVLINPLAYTLATTVCVSVKNVKTTVPSCVQKYEKWKYILVCFEGFGVLKWELVDFQLRKDKVMTQAV